MSVNKFNLALCKVLNLDPAKVRRIYIKCEAQSQPTVEITYSFTEHDRLQVIETFKGYTLVEEEKVRP